MPKTHGSSSARVLANAQSAAGRYKHRFVHTEYLLLGLLHEKNSAVRLLESLGYDRDRIQQACKKHCRKGEHVMQDNLKLTPNTQRIMLLAEQQCKALGHRELDSRHILLGMVMEENGEAGEILRHSGLTEDAVRDAIQRGAGKGTSASHQVTPPRPSMVQPADTKPFWKLWGRTSEG